MDRQTIFVVTVTIAVVNGVFSPIVGLAYALAPVWLPEFLPVTPGVLLYLSSLIVATATLLIAGVPAALCERLIDRRPDSRMPALIWLGTALTLSLPALNRLSEF